MGLLRNYSVDYINPISNYPNKMNKLKYIVSFVFALTLILGATVLTNNKTAEATEESTLENTFALCHDGIDNDMNLKTDLADDNCNPFATPAPVPENSALLCADNIDNDQDLKTDMTDEDCTPFATPSTEGPATTTATTTPTQPSTGGSSSSNSGPTASGGTSSFSTGGTGSTGGTVLGASTDTEGSTCSSMIVEYLRKGKKNTPTEVKKLQSALNSILGTKLPITGYFGNQTDSAVRKLQQQYSAEILKPWVDAKLMAVSAPTGYVYKTTKWFINRHLCSSANIAAPVLK